MNIGLTQRVEVLPDRNERRDGLDQSWSKLLLQIGYTPVLLPNQPHHAQALIDAFGLSGVILTGGNDLAELPDAKSVAPERDAFERAVLDICSTRSLPVLGVCRGMQMLVSYHGGRLIQVEGHVRKSHPIIPRETPMPTLPRAEVNSFHTFGVRPESLPGDLLPAGVAPDGSVEAVVHRQLPQWAIMWHPERPTHPSGPRDERDVAMLRALFGGTHA